MTIRLFELDVSIPTASVPVPGLFYTTQDVQNWLEDHPDYHVVKVVITPQHKDIFVIWAIDPRNI